MPYFEPNKYFTDHIGISFRKPKTISDLVRGIDDLTIWRNHLDLFEVGYVVCLYSDGTVKLETDNYIANFDASNNYKFIGME